MITQQRIPVQPYHLVVIVVFFVLGLLNILHHELWRDEMQAWSLAYHSDTLGHLYQNTRYEGHPLLWFLILFLVTSVSSNVMVMQFVHLLIAGAAVVVFLLYSPFSKVQKILYSFGYFAVYEYCVISRNYGISVLLLFLCCVLLTRTHKRYILLGILLVLLAQTNIFYTILAVMLAGYALLDYWLYPSGKFAWRTPSMGLVVGALIFIIGLLATAYNVIPPADGGWASGWNLEFDPGAMVVPITHIWDSYVPIPQLTREFWNTNAFDWLGALLFQHHGKLIRMIKLFLCVGIIVYLLLLFIRKPAVFFLFAFGTLVIMVFGYVKYLENLRMRHLGSLFYLLIASYWLSYYAPFIRIPFRRIASASDFCYRYRQTVLTAILVTGVFGAGVAMYMDYHYPFSESKNVADFIEDNGYKAYPTVGVSDFAMTPIAGYLGKDIYYPQANRWGSYIIWDNRRTGATEEECLKRTHALMNTLQHDVLIIFSQEPKTLSFPLMKVREFTSSIAKENYYIYLMKYSSRI